MSVTAGTSSTRLDVALVERGLARSRGQARELIDGGQVLVAGTTAAKAGLRVASDAEITVSGPTSDWVGRGADKLAAALDRWAPELAVAGKRAADIGASTGGFTQVLLAAGASRVYAVDVGHDQLVPLLRDDPRVQDLSGISIRGLDPDVIGGPVPLVVADLSFISLVPVLGDLARLCAPGADLVLLVKPQYEVGRARLGKKGVVTDADARAEALRAVLNAAREGDLALRDLMASPMTGTHGNHEYLVWLSRAPADVGGTWEAAQQKITELTRTGP